jgi:proteic killer suppression protein
MSIQSFGDIRTEKIFLGVKDKEVATLPFNVIKIAERKLDMIEAAAVLQDLASSPGNRLHALKQELKGFHAISINDQWRVIFKWETDAPHQVEIRDYH